MGLALNWAAAMLLSLTIAFYVFVYTAWLKRRTPHNIVIGGAAGAFPPIVGWAAVTGDIGLGAMVMFAVIFMWTPPHFWALALTRRDDYEKAGIPMLPVVAGVRETKKQMVLYTALLVPLSMIPTWIGMAGWLYFTVAASLGLAFLALTVAVWFDAGDRYARRVFAFSIAYLFLLFATLIADRSSAVA